MARLAQAHYGAHLLAKLTKDNMNCNFDCIMYKTQNPQEAQYAKQNFETGPQSKAFPQADKAFIKCQQKARPAQWASQELTLKTMR